MGYEFLLSSVEVRAMEGPAAASMTGSFVLKDLMDVAVEIWRPD